MTVPHNQLIYVVVNDYFERVDQPNTTSHRVETDLINETNQSLRSSLIGE